jgi:alanine racemase
MLSWEHTPSLTPMQRDRAWVEVNISALAHNIRQLKRSLSPATDLMAVVKADAYGHGAVTVARAALEHGATWLGVATIPEGIELRQAGITAPILLLGATNLPEQVRTIVQWKLQPTLCTPKQVLVFSETLAALGTRHPLPVHLKLDTGMSRLGAPWQQAAEFAQQVARSPYLHIASIYSHLATADSPDPTVMDLQHWRFETAIAQIRNVGIEPPKLHLANSAATLADPQLHYDMVRVGLAVYGLSPAPHLADVLDLKPVLQVKTRVTQVKPIQAGTGVSYGYKFVAERDLLMAVVGIGYADGVPRNLSNQMTALIRGQRVRQIGAITMDQLMLDVSTIPDLREGEIVTLLGQDDGSDGREDGGDRISAEDWATTLGTISWEILCGFKHRLPRLTVNHSVEMKEFK